MVKRKTRQDLFSSSFFQMASFKIHEHMTYFIDMADKETVNWVKSRRLICFVKLISLMHCMISSSHALV